jgi:hypothetical protein
MINTIKSGTHLNDPRDDQRPPRKPPEAEATASPSPPAKSTAVQPDVRLLIEEAEGVLIYKLIDRATGDVVSIVSRDDLMKMGADPLYTAGKVISTQA